MNTECKTLYLKNISLDIKHPDDIPKAERWGSTVDVKQKSISMTNAIMAEDVKQIALRTG